MLQYEPLETENSIRVVVLNCGSRGDPIECYLRQIRLGDQAAEYEALSYEWQPPGSDTAKFNISIDGTVVAIRRNLYDALRHLRHETQGRVLWIDAPCINQSELKERNHQVYMIGKIYSRAIRVLAWTGLADKDSDVAFDFIANARRRIERHTDYFKQFSMYVPTQLKFPGRHPTEDAVYIDLSPCGCASDSFWVEGFQFRAFLSWNFRSYWLRLWIIQELYLSRDLWIYAYPQCFSDIVWKPTATKIDNTYLHGYDDETDALLEAMPKISENEATLLYDLLSKIIVYDPQKRLSAREMLSHPWFHMDGQTMTREWRTDSEGLE
ncbi:uncharacterized protein PAC_12489 [Phialocephala subalpina]|uniref:Heterokaryon incompatibility domain-containing protein n=1 Tax=Phialocephala subalpina TaxID=576137 RepID=A0A1L7XC45_9HELO|nr:uncharacterized protein PAC_12489 [Phialocephala subalpina]